MEMVPVITTGAVGVAEYKLDVPQPDRRDVAGKDTVTVSRSMGKSSGVVLVRIYDGEDSDFTALKGLEAASTVIAKWHSRLRMPRW